MERYRIDAHPRSEHAIRGLRAEAGSVGRLAAEADQDEAVERFDHDSEGHLGLSGGSVQEDEWMLGYLETRFLGSIGDLGLEAVAGELQSVYVDRLKRCPTERFEARCSVGWKQSFCVQLGSYH